MAYPYDYKKIWQDVLVSVREKIGENNFDIWFSSAEIYDIQNNNIYIIVDNTLLKEMIESRYIDLLNQIFRNLSNQDINLIIITEPINENKGASSTLNSKYTFDTFIVGNSNRFAHAAAYAVSETPSKAYNPLFLYGGVGLGKTHLMQAIGQHILKKDPSAGIMYVSSEQFTNDLIASIRYDSTVAFRNKYRNIDVLLIDDIHFLAGKERTQEEFFHTFNTLYESNKQLVISSDRPPRSIPTLEERLRSRFEWGLITDIQPPDLETRIAILRNKSQSYDLNISYDILDYIANCIDSNIRELEGTLIRLVAYITLNKAPLNMDTAIEALKDIIPASPPSKITIEFIQKNVCKYYNIEMSDILSVKKDRKTTLPRQIAMYLCRKLTDASLPQIGYQFGGRDHSTVHYAIGKIDLAVSSDKELDLDIKKICNLINPTNIS